jgi:hypothetical protein
VEAKENLGFGKSQPRKQTAQEILSSTFTRQNTICLSAIMTIQMNSSGKSTTGPSTTILKTIQDKLTLKCSKDPKSSVTRGTTGTKNAIAPQLSLLIGEALKLFMAATDSVETMTIAALKIAQMTKEHAVIPFVVPSM